MRARRSSMAAMAARALSVSGFLVRRADAAPAVRALALRLLSQLAAATPNINANVLAGYFMARELA